MTSDSWTGITQSARTRIIDVGLGVIEPVWASDGVPRSPTVGGSGTLQDFSGDGRLRDSDIMLQIDIQAASLAAAGVTLHLDAAVPAALAPAGIWLPAPIIGLVPTANGEARTIGQLSSSGSLRNFLIPESDTEMAVGNTIELVLEVGGLYTARTADPDDPRTVRPWELDIAAVVEQRGGVTILNNLINPDRGEQVTLQYRTARSGLVSVSVTDLEGGVIDILFRGMQSAEEHVVTWDGRNRGGRAVARGVYFMHARAPGTNETRKVLVVR